MQPAGVAHQDAPHFHILRGIEGANPAESSARYNALPIDQVETRLYKRVNAATHDQALRTLPVESRLPYLTWAFRDVEKIPFVQSEFAEVARQANRGGIPAGALSDFFARRSVGKITGPFQNMLSGSLRLGHASQALNMLAYRLEHIDIAPSLEHSPNLEDPNVVHTYLQVPQRAARGIAQINKGTARTQIWWNEEMDDQDIIHLRPSGTMPEEAPLPEVTSSHHGITIEEIRPEEAAAYEAEHAMRAAAAEAERERERTRRANFKPNYRFAGESSERPAASQTPPTPRQGQLGAEEYNRIATAATAMRARETQATAELPHADRERNNAERRADKAEQHAGAARTHLHELATRLRDIESQALSEVLQGRPLASASTEALEAFHRAQQQSQRVQQDLQATQQQVCALDQQQPQQLRLAQVRHSVAQAEQRIATSGLDQAQSDLDASKIQAEIRLVKNAIRASQAPKNIVERVVDGIRNTFSGSGPSPEASLGDGASSSSSYPMPATSNLRPVWIYNNVTRQLQEVLMSQTDHERYQNSL